MSYIDPSKKLMKHVPQLMAVKAGLNPAPINVEIDLSNRCSLGCEWCHFAYTHTRGPLKGKREKPPNFTAGGDLMDTALAFKIIEQLAAAGVKSITWTGGGEPTLHPDFDDIIAYTKGRNLSQGIYTHGGHISVERAKLMKRVMSFVYVSLDALGREDYKKYKGVDRFDAACDGIRRLVASDGPATIGFGFLVTKNNASTAPQALPLARSLGADYIQYRPTIAYEQSNPGVPGEDTSWISEAVYALSRIEDSPDVEVDLSRFRMYQNWKGHGYGICYWSMLQTVITPNGKMWTCVNKREHSGDEIGDLSVEDFDVVWKRHSLAKVDSNCRVMCRGHIANKTAVELFAPVSHSEFV